MHWFVNIYFNMAYISSAKKQRDRKPNFTQEEVNVIQDQVQKNYKVLNEKFGDGVTNSRKTAVWSRISILVSALGVANRSTKDCKDKWANTKKEAKKVFSQLNKEQRATGGGPQPKRLSLAIERTIDLCKDSASFKGLEGVESVLVDNSAALPEESATNSQDLFDTPPSQPLSLSGSDSIHQPLPLLPLLPAVNTQVPCPAAAVVELGTLTTQKAVNPKKRKATADDVYELQILYLKGEMTKQTKEMRKLDLQIELLEEMKRDKENTPLTFSQLLMN
ncbi:uncharacterized protein LOC127704421 [Mytilus californianus]|uniref:uncharacterized protein LOC127704421 n=1 Tax=Mytilus californianus TaxID=6549 RepID=UPI002246A510|nr:uncharacterized protein LOC127704421 [Mytilus californianus]